MIKGHDNMYRAIIFDLDGTLINSLTDIANSVNHGLEKMGYLTHPTDKYKKFVGSGALKLCERALKGQTDSKEKILQLHKYFSEYYDKHCFDNTCPYEGIKELLAELKSKGIKLAVASNKPDEYAKQLVTSMFGHDVFTTILGKHPSRDVKPAPDIVFDIMKDMNVSKENIFLAGDSDIDMLTARHAGIDSIGCTWGFRTEEELIASGAGHIIHTPNEMLQFL